jgi:hypothetical protein
MRGKSREMDDTETDERILDELPEGDDGWEYLDNGDKKREDEVSDTVESQDEPINEGDRQGKESGIEKDTEENERGTESDELRGVSEEDDEGIPNSEEGDTSTGRGISQAIGGVKSEMGKYLNNGEEEREEEQADTVESQNEPTDKNDQLGEESETESDDTGKVTEERSEEVSGAKGEEVEIDGPESSDIRSLEEAALNGNVRELSDALEEVKSEVRKGHIITFVRDTADSVSGSFAPGDSWGETTDEYYGALTELGWVRDGKLTAIGASILSYSGNIINDAGDEAALVGYLNSVGVDVFLKEALRHGPDDADEGDGGDGFLGGLLG